MLLQSGNKHFLILKRELQFAFFNMLKKADCTISMTYKCLTASNKQIDFSYAENH